MAGRDGAGGDVEVIPLVRTRFDKWALPIAILGVAAAAAYNWRQWQRDKAFLAERAEPEPLPPLGEWPDLPLVSVLVAAWNEAEHIDRHIQSFLALRYPQKELVLCAGGDDDTLERAIRYAGPEVRVLPQVRGEGKQRALARSFQETQGEVIFLTDADCLLDDACFEQTLAALVIYRGRVATGRFAPFPEQRSTPFVLQQWYVDTYWRAHSPDYVEGLIGRNAAVLTSTLHEIGGFAEDVQTGTDYYLAQQLVAERIPIRYVHASTVDTAYVTGFSTYLRQQSRWLRNIVLHGSAFGAVSQVRQAVFQCLSGLAFILWPLTFVLTGFIGITVWLLALSYGTLARWRYIRFGEESLAQSRRTTLYLAAPLYFLFDQIMLGYSALGLLLPSLRWRW